MALIGLLASNILETAALLENEASLIISYSNSEIDTNLSIINTRISHVLTCKHSTYYVHGFKNELFVIDKISCNHETPPIFVMNSWRTDINKCAMHVGKMGFSFFPTLELVNGMRTEIKMLGIKA